MIETAGRVLYVEDHDDTRVLMTVLLERAGFAVTAVPTAAEGLQLARDGGFDLYLLDHTFPDASGVMLCRALREFDPRIQKRGPALTVSLLAGGIFSV